MSISISSSSVSGFGSVSKVTSSPIASAIDAATGDDSSDSSSVSGPAAMMNKLKALQKSDPAKFKEAMSAISKKLTEEADASTDDEQKAMLTDMASKFSSAGETGDLSSLQPPAPPSGASAAGAATGGHGGPPPGGGGASSSTSSSSSTSTQAADTNGDGKVSEAELEAYTLKQEEKGVESTSSSSSSATKHAAQAYKKLQGDGPSDAIRSAISDIASIVDQYAA